MFDNVARLGFAKDDQGIPQAIEMHSSEGEQLAFKAHVACEGRIEEWMTRVEAEMKQSNRMVTKEAIYRYCEKMPR